MISNHVGGRFRAAAAVAVGALVTFAATTALAGPGGHESRDGAEAVAGVASGPVALQRVRTDDTERSTETVAWANLPNGNYSVTVGAGRWLFTARFDGESACFDSGNPHDPNATASGYCTMRILFNGVPGYPKADGDLSFDNLEGANTFDAPRESHAFTRSLLVTGPGTVVVQVQWAVRREDRLDNFPRFTLDDWTLLVQAASGGAGTA